ncbi:MAG TPA: DUF3107 domain-containing protein [Propionicimonas sp.]|nr:DUF3107 domain-containing protein [Propionicimonas sp.]
MEIKIGIQEISRELTVETEATAAQVEKDLKKALDDDGLLTLTDDKGRKVLIPADRIAYLDLGQEKSRPVGFGTV